MIDFSNLHGRATLTLRDANSGRILHRESHSNEITPALERIFKRNIAGTLDYAKITPVLDRMLGGVLAFQETGDPTKVFLPKANVSPLTAHAGQTTYSSAADDPKRGNPNTSQSGPITGGYRFVWTFDKTQGNGVIKSLALTHADTGDFWNESTPSSMSQFCPVEFVGNKTLSAADFGVEPDTPIKNQERIPVGYWEDINHVVSFKINKAEWDEDPTQRNITIYISKWTGDGCYIYNELGEPYDEETFEIALPKFIYGTFEQGYVPYYFAYDPSRKLMYWMTCGTLHGTDPARYEEWDRTLEVTTIDLTAKTATTKLISLAATLGGQYICAPFVAWLPIQLQIVNDCVFLPTYDHTVYPFGWDGLSIQVNLQTDTAAMVSGFFGEEAESNHRQGCGQIALGNGRIMNPVSMAYVGSNGLYQGQRTYTDPAVFATWLTDRFFDCTPLTDELIHFYTLAGHDAASMNCRGALLNKLYQATVFNLEEPVVKTAGLTMQIDYEIYQGGAS